MLIPLQGLSRSALFTAVNDSLARLETDYIDVFWIHRFDPYTPIEETMRALRDLVTYGGKFGYIGASSMWTYQFALMHFCAEKNGWTKFVAMQVIKMSKFVWETLIILDSGAESYRPSGRLGKTPLYSYLYAC